MLSFHLVDLIPHTQYNISVSSKPTNNGYWSDPSFLLIQTLQSGNPIRVPYPVYMQFVGPLIQLNSCVNFLHFIDVTSVVIFLVKFRFLCYYMYAIVLAIAITLMKIINRIAFGSLGQCKKRFAASTKEIAV